MACTGYGAGFIGWYRKVEGLDFDELTYVSEEDWEKFHNTELTAEDLQNISYIGAEYSNFGHTAEYELEADPLFYSNVLMK